jgi:hypothetical protein
MAVYEMPGLKETTHAQLGVLAGPASGDCGPAVEEDQYKAEPPPWVGPKMGSIHGGSGDELHPGADPERGSRCRYPGILIWLNEVCGSQSLA